MKITKKLILKYNNSLGGYRPFNWRYKNSGWKLISQMPKQWQEDIKKEHLELFGKSNKGATKEQMLSYGHKESEKGGFIVEWDFDINVKDKPKKVNYDYPMFERHILDQNKESDLPKDYDLSSSYSVYVTEYRKKWYCGTTVDTDSMSESLGEHGPFKTERDAWQCGKDIGEDWLYLF